MQGKDSIPIDTLRKKNFRQNTKGVPCIEERTWYFVYQVYGQNWLWNRLYRYKIKWAIIFTFIFTISCEFSNFTFLEKSKCFTKLLIFCCLCLFLHIHLLKNLPILQIVTHSQSSQDGRSFETKCRTSPLWLPANSVHNKMIWYITKLHGIPRTTHGILSTLSMHVMCKTILKYLYSFNTSVPLFSALLMLFRILKGKEVWKWLHCLIIL